MRLTAKAIRISRAKFHCNRLTAVQDIQDIPLERNRNQSQSDFVLVAPAAIICIYKWDPDIVPTGHVPLPFTWCRTFPPSTTTIRRSTV